MRFLYNNFAATLRVTLLVTLLIGITPLAHAADTLFAAPTASSSIAGTGTGSAGHVTLALAVVLASVFVAAWMLKKMRKLQAGANAVDIKILAQVSLGAKERAVLLQVKGVQLLVGVCAGQINTLHTFSSTLSNSSNPPLASNAIEPVAGDGVPQENRPSFQSILKRSLGLS